MNVWATAFSPHSALGPWAQPLFSPDECVAHSQPAWGLADLVAPCSHVSVRGALLPPFLRIVMSSVRTATCCGALWPFEARLLWEWITQLSSHISPAWLSFHYPYFESQHNCTLSCHGFPAPWIQWDEQYLQNDAKEGRTPARLPPLSNLSRTLWFRPAGPPLQTTPHSSSVPICWWEAKLVWFL